MSGGKDGFAVFQELRRDSATRSIPVIFLTSVNQTAHLAFGSAEIKQYLGELPAAFLEKPVSDYRITAAVARILESEDRVG